MIKLKYGKQEWELEGTCALRKAIEKVGLNPQAVLAVRDGKLITGAKTWRIAKGWVGW